jgi:hypothetical protein
MKKITKEQLRKDQHAEQIRRKRLRTKVIEKVWPRDLEEIKRRGISPAVVVDNAVMAAERRMDFFPEKYKQDLRDRSMLWKELLNDIEKLRKKGHTIVGLPEALKPWAESLRDGINVNGQYLRKNGHMKHDQSLSIFVKWIVEFNANFKSWNALARVLEEAYRVAGRDIDAEQISADKLIRIARLQRKGVTP